VIDGLVVVDKPTGCTSHDVVAQCRRIFGQRRVGHSGTLDPDATGVLLVGLGQATRLLRFLSDLPKSYRGEVVLGEETSTLDAAGVVTATHDMGAVTLEDARRAAADFVGAIEQVPPMVSALKVGGRRLHELAREGKEVDRAPRPVTVYRFDVVSSDDSILAIEVDCSTGTYVRSLAADLGHALGGGAHLRKLRRTAIGPFSHDSAVPLSDVGPDSVVAPLAAVGHLEAVSLSGDEVASARQGVLWESMGSGPGPWAVVGPEGDLVAVYERHHDGRRAKPAVVLNVRNQ